jgi:hypothetical protein
MQVIIQSKSELSERIWLTGSYWSGIGRRDIDYDLTSGLATLHSEQAAVLTC